MKEFYSKDLSHNSGPFTHTFTLTELLDLEKLQSLQDRFSAATGVAAIITDIDGVPITMPSNFCRFCQDVIRKTEKGRQNCMKSDALIGGAKNDTITIQRCLSGGLVDGGVPIIVGGRHVANWLVGQVLDSSVDTEAVLKYALEIGADADEALAAMSQVTRMTRKQFISIVECLHLIAQQLSALAAKSYSQACELRQRMEAEQEILRLNEELKKANAQLEKELSKKDTLNERLQKYQLLTENANDAMLFVDKDGQILDVNDRATRMYGYTREEFAHMNIFELRRAERATHILEQMEIADQYGILFETIHYRKNGTSLHVEVSSKGAFFDNRRVLLSIIRDISDRKRVEEENCFIIHHDQLTGLYNRRYYEEELRRLDTGSNLPLSLILGDINGLKLTNDAFGHLTGDRLIKRAGECMKRECREHDILARIGGDEFVIVLPRTDAASTEKIVGRMMAAIKNQVVGNVLLSISFGWATKHSPEDDISKVFVQAEDFMYRKKLFESSSMKHQTIKLITNSLYERYSDEQAHAERVSKLSKAIARASGISADDMSKVEIAGLFHDIGKIGIDEAVLKKPGTLNDEEWVEIKRHSEIGYQILSSVSEFSQTAGYVLAHHEHWDGTGYPKGLKGTEIPMAARIIAIADSYAAMTSDRTYRKALPSGTAVTELQKSAGHQFDPELIDVFLRMITEPIFND